MTFVPGSLKPAGLAFLNLPKDLWFRKKRNRREKKKKKVLAITLKIVFVFFQFIILSLY